MKTWDIHIEGMVQGVGFRPYVYREAKRRDLCGWVNNGLDGVHIKFNAESDTAHEFYNKLTSSPPLNSWISDHSLNETDSEQFLSFNIMESTQSGRSSLLITPDLAMCSECEEELFSINNRRFEYPFITCTNCGPRYSIVQNLPFDRENTTMNGFTMCDHCSEEYNDPLQRRHFSQTNSCDPCGIELSLLNHKENIHKGNTDEIIKTTCQHLLQGAIIGVKGIGGFLILADARNEDTVKKLRIRKKRPFKPFALMYPDINTLKGDAYVSPREEKLITSTESPIVLLKAKKKMRSGIAAKSIAPGLNEIGVMRPYTPLFALIMQKIGHPLIATSGNISGSPVIYKDDQASDQLLGICDYLLTNNRKIVVPQDDSVEKILLDNTKLILRRSRGYAPTFIHNGFNPPDSDVISMGAMLKSSFAFIHRGNTYISQYLGDLGSFDTQESYNHTIEHFFDLFNLTPQKVLIDSHPGYYSSQRGIEIGNKLGIPVRTIQHHEAHLMAVLNENKLDATNKKILGVIWDGTGLGFDGAIWGGEYFIYQNREIRRIDHIPYYDHLLGDKFAYEPRLSALSLCHSYCLNSDSLSSKFNDKEWNFFNKILDNDNNLKTSSMGRLFDAVSSILGIKDYNSFEGEAAMHLQAYAERFIRKNGIIDNTYLSNTGDLGQCLNEIMIGVNAKIKTGKIAYDFLNWLVNQIREVTIQQDVGTVVFSGGVFQNSLLVELLKKRLSPEFDLYFHKKLSPNDECISFGQLAYEYMGVKSVSETELDENKILIA